MKNQKRIRDYGICIGKMKMGSLNSLICADTMTGRIGRIIRSLKEYIDEIIKK